MHEHHWWLEDSVTGQVLKCLCGARREIGEPPPTPMIPLTEFMRQQNERWEWFGFEDTYGG